jgi:hypothetical protein
MSPSTRVPLLEESTEALLRDFLAEAPGARAEPVAEDSLAEERSGLFARAEALEAARLVLEIQKKALESDRAALAALVTRQVEKELGDSRAALAHERGEIAALRDLLAAERTSLARERAAVASEARSLGARLDEALEETLGPAREELDRERERLAGDREQLVRDREGLAADRAALERDRAALARRVEAGLGLDTKAIFEEREKLAVVKAKLESAKKQIEEVVRERVAKALAEERGRLEATRKQLAGLQAALAAKKAALEDPVAPLAVPESGIELTSDSAPASSAEPRRPLLKRRRVHRHA